MTMTMHHLSAEEITAYLDGECTQAELQAASSHLETCTECRQVADDQQFVKTLMGSLNEVELPRSFALTSDMVQEPSPLASPGESTSTSTAGGNLIRFEPVTRLLSIAAVLAFLVLGGAQLAGVGEQSDSTSNQAIELSETDSADGALQEQEPALARGEVREQGESAAANAAPLTSESARVDTQSQASDNGLTLLELTTIGVGLVALASIASWILIHYRAGATSNNS